MAWIEKTGTHSWRVRYPTSYGRYGTISGFSTAKAARAYANDLETDRRRGTWIDPAAAKTALAAWSAPWVETLDVEPRTDENYRGCLRNHILPRWGDTALGSITPLDVTTWLKHLREQYAPSTVTTIRTVFSMLLDDAVDQRLIAANPVRRRRRRGRRRDHAPSRAEKVFAMPDQICRIAEQAAALGGPGAGLLIVTAAWTGCRWGELAGLQRQNLDLHRGVIVIDPDYGALHESARHGIWLGPPKTPASARTVTLPPFLVDLLREHLATTLGSYVFTSPRGHPLRRSSFDRRVFRPAVDGNTRRGLSPIRPGLTFHGLRHSHKTWLIADHIPEIAQARRLGHHLANRLTEVYSHVAPEIETQLLKALQRRWDTAHRTCRPTDNRPHQRPARHVHHTAPAHRTTTPRPNTAIRHQVTRPHHQPTAPIMEAKILQKSSMSVHRPDQPEHPAGIMERMKKALRPAKTLKSEGFVREWS